ncbi:unnamed protein product [Prunus armeniaca]|uniref:Uncharacterized protein n=1 Tax=Prunus armeniaca TaxID=36596 RepID=A0A6J5U990_PRUAR|nr:unnamed protein product [Prunus armeniaca]
MKKEVQILEQGAYPSDFSSYLSEGLKVRFEPKKTQKPIVERRSSGQPTQSAKENAVRSKCPLVSLRPLSEVPLSGGFKFSSAGWSGAWFGVKHVSFGQEVMKIFGLGKKNGINGALNLYAKKVMNGAKIFHGKLRTKFMNERLTGMQRKKQSPYQGESDKALHTMSVGLVSCHTITCGVDKHEWDARD